MPRSPTLTSVVRTLTTRLGRPQSDAGHGADRVVTWASGKRRVTVSEGPHGIRVQAKGRDGVVAAHVAHPREVAAWHWLGRVGAMLTADAAVELAALALV